MVGNAMVYSRFRYWAHCLALSKEVRAAIGRDVQALIWGKDIHFDPDEFGSEKTKGFIKFESQCWPCRQGGIGTLYWEAGSRESTNLLHPIPIQQRQVDDLERIPRLVVRQIS